MKKYKENLSMILVVITTALLTISGHSNQSVEGQIQGGATGLTGPNQVQTFASAYDTFVTSQPQGYGVYEEKESDTFEPGEDIILYIEPVGFEYGSSDEDEDKPLYTIDFTADFVISDSEGNVLTGQQGLPVSNISSYHQNKEVFIPFTITQTSPFPSGDYIVTYTIHDDNSGNSFNIIKEITISEN